MDIPRSIGKMCTLAGKAELNENALDCALECTVYRLIIIGCINSLISHSCC